MQALINNTTNVAYAAAPDGALFELTDRGLRTASSRLLGVTPATTTIVTAPDLDHFIPEVYALENGVWSVVNTALFQLHFNDRKRSKREAVNALRDQKMFEDFTFNGVVYQADQLSQNRLDRARTSALAAIAGGAQPDNYRWHGEAQDFFWIAKDNSQNTMDAQTTLAFGNAMVAREGMLIAAAAAIKSAIDAITADATTAQEELDAIDITTGWPS